MNCTRLRQWSYSSSRAVSSFHVKEGNKGKRAVISPTNVWLSISERILLPSYRRLWLEWILSCGTRKQSQQLERRRDDIPSCHDPPTEINNSQKAMYCTKHKCVLEIYLVGSILSLYRNWNDFGNLCLYCGIGKFYCALIFFIFHFWISHRLGISVLTVHR